MVVVPVTAATIGTLGVAIPVAAATTGDVLIAAIAAVASIVNTALLIRSRAVQKETKRDLEEHRENMVEPVTELRRLADVRRAQVRDLRMVTDDFSGMLDDLKNVVSEAQQIGRRGQRKSDPENTR